MSKKKAERPNLRNIFVLRGTDEYKAWMDSLADYSRMPLTILVEHALKEWAKRKGHAAPPRRTR